MILGLPPLVRPLTVGDFAEIDNLDCHSELQEGSLLLIPGCSRSHQIARIEMAGRLEAQIPEGFELLAGIHVDLGLVPPDRPGPVAGLT